MKRLMRLVNLSKLDDVREALCEIITGMTVTEVKAWPPRKDTELYRGAEV